MFEIIVKSVISTIIWLLLVGLINQEINIGLGMVGFLGFIVGNYYYYYYYYKTF